MLEVKSSQIPPSKSLYNRALILKSFEPDLKIQTNCPFVSEDVELLKKALEDFSLGKNEFYVGSGAAPLKFLALRLSRQKGFYVIKGTERLFSRPIDELLKILRDIGCEQIEVTKSTLSFSSPDSWPTQLSVTGETSSQTISALMLSSWELEENLELHINSSRLASASYLEMTLGLMNGAAWSGEFKKNDDGTYNVLLPKKQFVVLDEFFVEPDMSCVSVLALASALKDGVLFKAMLPSSMQGDQVIFSILEKMGVKVETRVDKNVDPDDVFFNLPHVVEINVSKIESKRGLEANLFSTPDLFPVLAAFSATASEASHFSGLENLNSKESKRLDKIAELLTAVGVGSEKTDNSFKVFPSKLSTHHFDFSPDQDHRLAMAATLLNLQGAKINILSKDVVNKSFPNFWNLIDQLN